MSAEPQSPSNVSSPYPSPDVDVETEDTSISTSHLLGKAPPYNTTVVELVSISATSSAFPESFGLAVSQRGRWIVAYSSAALYILLAEELPSFRNICRAFRLRRKPLAVAITDIGKFAILTSSFKVDIYQCGDGSALSLREINTKVQTVLLNNEAKTISFAASGDLIVAGSETGVEIVGLASGSDLDRRQINCGGVESAVFSQDAKSILATAPARRSTISTFLTIAASFEQAYLDDDENQEEQPVGKQWISQLIFPERISAKQAVFLPDPSNTGVNELVAFNPQFEQFGIFDTAMKQFNGKMLGIPHNVIWTRTQRFDDTLPAVCHTGKHVATAVRLEDSTEIWAYELSTEWREDMSTTSTGNASSAELEPSYRLIFPAQEIRGAFDSIVSMRWLQLPESEPDRLLAMVNTTNFNMPEDEVPLVDIAASGKILVYDFRTQDHHTAKVQKITINLDDFALTEDLLDEEDNIEREVDIVRRRTQYQRTQTRPRDVPLPNRDPRLRRSFSSSSRTSEDMQSNRPRRRRSFTSISDVSEETEHSGMGAPMGAPVDEPYSMQAPRSHFTLDRAATVAQNSTAGRMHLRSHPNQPIPQQRADGSQPTPHQIPHESDADNWVPPPPPYTERPDKPGPNAKSLAVPEAIRAAVLQGQYVQKNRSAQSSSSTMPSARVAQVMSNYPAPSNRGSRVLNRSHTAVATPSSSASTRPPAHRRPHSTVVPNSANSANSMSVNTNMMQQAPQAPQNVSPQGTPSPPVLTQSSTFPTRRSTGRNVPSFLSINPNVPTIPAAHPSSAPVTPNNRGNFPAEQLRQNTMYDFTSAEVSGPTSYIPLQSSPQNRSDTNRPLPPVPSDSQQTSTSLPSRPTITPLSTNIQQSQDSSPDTPASRRSKWRVHKSSLSRQETASSRSNLGRPEFAHSTGHMPLDSKNQKKSKCVIQ